MYILCRVRSAFTPLHAPTLSSVLTVWTGQNFHLCTLCHPLCSLPGLAAVSPWACAHAARSWGSITQFPACPPQGEERRNSDQSDCPEGSVNSQPQAFPLLPCPRNSPAVFVLTSAFPVTSSYSLNSSFACWREWYLQSSVFSFDGLGMPGLLQSSYPAKAMKDDAFIASPCSCHP